MKKCPYCAEEIQDEAIFCRFCKHDLTNVPKVKMKKCPYCAEQIPETDIKCNICGHSLSNIENDKTTSISEQAGLSEKSTQSTSPEMTAFKAPVRINGSINGDTIEFEPPVIIKGIEYGSFQFDSAGAQIDKKDKAKAIRYAVEQLFRHHGFYRVRMDGNNAELSDQETDDFEDMIFWQFALPQKRFYPTIDDIINNSIVEIYSEGLNIQTRTLKVIEDNSSYDIFDLRNVVKKEKNQYALKPTPKKNSSINTTDFHGNGKAAEEQVRRNDNIGVHKGVTAANPVRETTTAVNKSNSSTFNSSGYILTPTENVLIIVVGVLTLLSSAGAILSSFFMTGFRFWFYLISGIIFIPTGIGVLMKKRPAVAVLDAVYLLTTAICAVLFVISLIGSFYTTFILLLIALIPLAMCIANSIMINIIYKGMNPEVQAKRTGASPEEAAAAKKAQKPFPVLLIVLIILLVFVALLIVVPTVMGYVAGKNATSASADGTGVYALKGVDNIDFDNLPSEYKMLEDTYKSMSETTYIALLKDGTGVYASEFITGSESFNAIEITEWTDRYITMRMPTWDGDFTNDVYSYTRNDAEIRIKNLSPSDTDRTYIFRYVSDVNGETLESIMNKNGLNFCSGNAVGTTSVTTTATTTTAATTTAPITTITTTTTSTAKRTNQDMYDLFQEAHKDDQNYEQWYCEYVDEVYLNGERCYDTFNNGYMWVNLYYTSDDRNSGTGTIFTLGLGVGYCEWAYMFGSGDYYIRWYPTYFDEGVYYEMNGSHLTKNFPELNGEF